MASPALPKYSWRCQDKGCRGNRISCHLWCRRKDHRAFYPQKNVCLLLTRTKRKVKANLLFPVKLLQKAAESIVLHCQEGTAVPVCQHHVRTKFPALLMALGSEPFVSQEKGSTTYSHPGGAEGTFSLRFKTFVLSDIDRHQGEEQLSCEWLLCHRHSSALGAQWRHWTGRRDVWGCNRRAPKAQKKPNPLLQAFLACQVH